MRLRRRFLACRNPPRNPMPSSPTLTFWFSLNFQGNCSRRKECLPLLLDLVLAWASLCRISFPFQSANIAKISSYSSEIHDGLCWIVTLSVSPLQHPARLEQRLAGAACEKASVMVEDDGEVLMTYFAREDPQMTCSPSSRISF
jgi:hypothetical protein